MTSDLTVTTSRPDRRRKTVFDDTRASRPIDAGPTERLLERGPLLEELRAQFDIADSLPPSPIVIEGRVGVGKTAMLRSAYRAALDEGWNALWGSGSDVESGAPYGVVRQLLASGTGSDREVTAALAAVNPERAPYEPTGLHRNGAQPFIEVFERLDSALQRLSDDRGVLIAVDDVQWADAASGEWLYYLARRLEGRRLRIVLTMPSRSTGMPLGPIERIMTAPSTRVISIGPLGYESTSALVSEHFADHAHDRFSRACHKATGGNPGLLFALLHEFPPDEFGPTEESAARIARIAPPVVARSVLLRLAALPAHALDLLHAVAVLGEQADLVVAAQIAGIDVSTASAIVDQLALVDVLQRERPIRFLHPLLRTTVYHDIEPARRTTLHVAAARCLHERDTSVHDLAAHLLAAEPTGDEWVATQMQHSGQLSLRQGAHDLALRCFRRAVAERSAGRASPELLLDLARAEAALGLPVAFQHLTAAANAGMEQLQLARVSLLLVRGFQDSPDTQEALAILSHVAPLLTQDHLELKIELEVVAGLLSRHSSGLLAAADTVTPLLAQLPRSGSRAEHMALALLATANVTSSRRATADEVALLARRALASPELVDGDPLAFRLRARAIAALARTGNFDEADAHARATRAAALELGLDLAVAEASTALALSLVTQGALSNAETEVRRALLGTQDRSWLGRPLALAVLTESLCAQGQLDEADMVIEACEESDIVSWSTEGRAMLEQRGRLRVSQGRHTEALEDLLLAGEQADEIGVDNPAVTSWRGEAVRALRGQHRFEEAAALARDNLARARAAGASWAIGSALRTMASVSALEERGGMLREAMAHLEDSPARLERAAVLVDLGALLHRQGTQIGAARDALRQGADLALQCGAAPLVSLAESALRQTGARPRRIALTGTDALTSGEQRVVTLAVSGRTNAEIAETLFVSEKTVEGHLRRAYRKLGIRSRRDLPPAMPSLGPPEGFSGNGSLRVAEHSVD